jgi:hypothetical protein
MWDLLDVIAAHTVCRVTNDGGGNDWMKAQNPPARRKKKAWEFAGSFQCERDEAGGERRD